MAAPRFKHAAGKVKLARPAASFKMKIKGGKNLQQRAIALVMVMLIVLSLGILAAGFAFSMKVEMRLASNITRDPDMEWLGRSGLELARFVLAEKMRIPEEARFDALSQMWAGGPLGTNDVLMTLSLTDVPLGNGIINVRIQDLERKLNINLADNFLLHRTMQAMGVDSFAAGTVVDSILDWMDSDLEPRLNGADGEDYLTAPNRPFPPYLPKNGPIDHITELLLIRGIEPSLYYGLSQETTSPFSNGGNETSRTAGLRDIFTSMGGPRVNINTASPAVLSLIPGLDEILAYDIVETRRGFDGIDGTLDDIPFRSLQNLERVYGMTPEIIKTLGRFCTVSSSMFEVLIESHFGDYTKTYMATLIRLNSRDVLVVSFHPI